VNGGSGSTIPPVVFAICRVDVLPWLRKSRKPSAAGSPEDPEEAWKMRTPPSREEFIKGIEAYQAHEKRDSMYKVATYLMEQFWGRPADMADALGVLLLTWNQAFYRYGLFDFDELERCIARNLAALDELRRMEISELTPTLEPTARGLFVQLLDALKSVSSVGQVRRSPVAVAKALHLLAPRFFPLWDVTIAREYGFDIYRRTPEKYIEFCRLMRDFAESVRDYLPPKNRSVLKLIDEYNYAKFVKRWI
jgi:hypothetical protein